jgi:hypothetical protein
VYNVVVQKKGNTMSKIKITNVTDGYLVINSIQISNNKLSIPPRAEAIVDAEYEDDSHVQELVEMKKIKVSSHDPQKKAESHRAKKAQPKTEEPLSEQEGRKVTYMSGQGSPKKASMVNSIEQQGGKKAPVDNGPLVDDQTEDAAEQPSEAFIPL